jgi:hypothetical protein
MQLFYVIVLTNRCGFGHRSGHTPNIWRLSFWLHVLHTKNSHSCSNETTLCFLYAWDRQGIGHASFPVVLYWWPFSKFWYQSRPHCASNGRPTTDASHEELLVVDRSTKSNIQPGHGRKRITSLWNDKYILFGCRDISTSALRLPYCFLALITYKLGLH